MLLNSFIHSQIYTCNFKGLMERDLPYITNSINKSIAKSIYVTPKV